MLRKWMWLGFFWLLSTSVGATSGVGDAFFDQSLGDFAVELKMARQQGRQGVLLVFEAENCPFCKRMRERVLSKPEVQAFYRKHFAVFSVDILGSVPVTDFAGAEQTEKSLARGLKVRGTPTFIFIGEGGREMARFVGMSRDSEEFMLLGRYVAEGHWQKMSFEQFRGQK